MQIKFTLFLLERQTIVKSKNLKIKNHEALNVGKTRITIMLDDSIIQSYKVMTGGRGYQTLINETLRRGLEVENVKNALREVLREEKCNWGG
jgi:uncharacterized protein (DUF4415 family)